MHISGSSDAGVAGSTDGSGKPRLLGRKSVLTGMAASIGIVLANASPPSAGAVGSVTYVPTWAPSTDYVLGEQIISPNNDVVSANVTHTSSAAYDADAVKWTLSSTYGTLPATLRPRGVFPSPPADLDFFSTFQPGHGYTKWNGTGTVNLNDTHNFAMGSQSITLTSPGTGSGWASIAKWDASSAVDITNRHFAMLVKIDDPTRLRSVTLLLGDTVFANNYGLIAHRGDTLGRSLNANEWTWLYFTQADFTVTTGTPALNNIKSVMILLAEVAGAGAPVTMQVQAFGTFVPKAASTPGGASAFPHGVITFTADDSYLSQYTLMAPRLDKYGYSANIMVIADNLDIPASNMMTLAQLEQMRDARLFEISGHAFTGANHALGFTNISPAACELELRNLKSWLLDHGFQHGADFMAWPLGLHNATTDKIARRYFHLARGTNGSPYPSPRVDAPMNVRAFGIAPPETVATLSTRIDSAYANGVWLILIIHDLTTRTTGLGRTQWNATDFATLLDYIKSRGMPVRTIGQVVQALG